jgi:hypothetical protein
MEKFEKGNKNTFYTGDNNSVFGIAFDKIFEKKEIDIFNDFEMDSKRNFKNLTPSILTTYEELFLDSKGKVKEELAVVLYDVLNVKVKLLVNEGKTTFEEFTGMLDTLIKNYKKLLINTIDEFVENNYALELDEITKKSKENKKKINEELQFSDKHAKTLLKIAYLYRIMIPIISVYFTYNKVLFAKSVEEAESEDFEDMQFDEINESIFAYLFEKFTQGDDGAKSKTKKFNRDAEALRNKLYKLTYSRVSKTTYSDRRFWNAAKTQGITKDTETLEIYKKLLTNAIPKLEIDKDKNIISFFQSVINNQIDFLFQNKFKYKFTSLGKVNEKYIDDDDDTSEYERLEIQMLRKDEGLYITRKLSIEQALRDIPRALGVEVSDEEVRSAVIYMTRHDTQEKIVSMITFKYFNDKQAIKFLTFYQYITLVLACYKYLSNHKFELLPQILVSNCEKHKERTGIAGKRIRPMIQESKKYSELFSTKYKNFVEEIAKPLSSIIATTYSSVFTNVKGEELFDSTVKVAKVADELLDLAFLI